MDATNLPELVFIRNGFMLQIVIKNGKGFKEKVPIDMEKVPIENFLANEDITEIMKKTILNLYIILENNRVFSRKDISELLDFSDRNSGKIISTMKHLNIIEPVTGKGKGKYIFCKNLCK